MKNLRIAALVMIVLTAMLSSSCSSRSTGESANAGTELWKILQETDWVGWSGGAGCEVKFAGNDKALMIEWVQDTVSGKTLRSGTDVGTVEILDENWFVMRINNKSTAYYFSTGDKTFESLSGTVFRKNAKSSFKGKK
jgi:hypothetical protein